MIEPTEKLPDDEPMPLETAEAIASHKTAAGSIEDWQAAAYTLHAELYQMRGDNEYLRAALKPLAEAWGFVSEQHNKLIEVANLDERYFWKPSSTGQQIPGLSWADAKYAHDVLGE